jgi:superfamily I DNA/RNA helicase
VTRTESLDLPDRADELAKTYAVLEPAVEAWKSSRAESLGSDNEEKRVEPAAASGVRFITLHSSKGLEARYVFIPFMESDVRLFAKDMEEQRRLLYVGITRARTAVVMSWAWSRQTAAKYKSGGGRLMGRTRHAFITECGISDSAADVVLSRLADLSKHEQEWIAVHRKA